MFGLWLEEQANQNLLGEKGKGYEKYLELRSMTFVSNKGGKKLEVVIWGC